MGFDCVLLLCTIAIDYDADKYLKDLASPDDAIVSSAEKSLVRIGKSDPVVVKSLIKLLAAPSPNLRMSAASILYRIGPNARPAVAAIAARLEDAKEDNDIRKTCALGLGLIGGEDAAKRLKEFVNSKEPLVRHWAAQSLPSLVQSNPDIVRELIPLFGHADRNVRDALGRSFSEGEITLAPYFMEALADNSPFVRVLAGRVLMRMRKDTERVVASQIEFLDNEDASIRYYAASSLRDTKKPRKEAIPKLIKMLNAKETDNRQIALYVLGDIGKEASISVEPVLACLKDKNNLVRLVAIQTLPQIDSGSPSVIKGLTSLLNKDEHPDVIIYAVSVLGRFGPRAKCAVDALNKMRTDKRFREAIDMALIRIEE